MPHHGSIFCAVSHLIREHPGKQISPSPASSWKITLITRLQQNTVRTRSSVRNSEKKPPNKGKSSELARTTDFLETRSEITWLERAPTRNWRWKIVRIRTRKHLKWKMNSIDAETPGKQENKMLSLLECHATRVYPLDSGAGFCALIDDVTVSSWPLVTGQIANCAAQHLGFFCTFVLRLEGFISRFLR